MSEILVGIAGVVFVAAALVIGAVAVADRLAEWLIGHDDTDGMA